MKEALKFEPIEPANPVAPVRPIAPYVGGKRALAKRLVEKIEAVPHAIYAEPFVGMGGVFFRRRRRPRKEVINDISAEVVELFCSGCSSDTSSSCSTSSNGRFGAGRSSSG